MITVDGRLYNVDVVEVGLDVEFIYKYAERTENYGLAYELGAVYYNQSLTFGVSGTGNKDFVDLFALLSTKSRIDSGTGHNVAVLTPLGELTFLMYPDKLSLQLLHLGAGAESWWSGFTVKFIAVKPVESW